ncbi:MAG: hypothetical protein ABI759_23105 [Candidatus Solibacter sp.]
MRRNVIIFSALSAAFLASCGKQDATAPLTAELPHATVVMRDGTKASGGVSATTASDITLNLDGGGSRTIPMKDVRRVDYGELASSVTPASPASPATAAAPPAPEPTHEEHYHPPAAAVQSKTLVLAAGTSIPVRNEETIDSGKAVEGQLYAAEIASDVKDEDGAIVIPRGSNAHLVIKSASKGGKIRGASDLVLDLVSVAIEGQQYSLDASDISQKGRNGVGANKRTGEFVGGGAAIGAIIGAIAGGGKGAAIGAGSGAAAGAVTQIVTKGSIKVPAETILTFKLDTPLRVKEAR